MKVPALLFTAVLLIPSFSMAQINLDKAAIRVERFTDLLLVTLPFEGEGTGPVMDDMIVTLLNDQYQSLAQVEKKVVLLGKQQEEIVALPIAANTPETAKCRIRIDFLGNTWLKQFTQEIQGQEIHIIGQKKWIAGSQTALRVIVSRSDNGAPVENAAVQAIFFQTTPAEKFFTGADGIVQVTVDVPSEIQGNQELRIVVQSPLGENTIASQIDVVPGTKIFLSTDKPVYQPNQAIHIRALAAHKTSGEPLANCKVILEVYDGKGNKVFKQEPITSEFGIVSADFQLADEVNQGVYKLQAILNDEISEKTVQVYEYVLPKFRVSVNTKEKFYAPGDKVSGTVEARYFFGKPVSGAKVTLAANCFDVGFNEFAKTEVTTNEEGKTEYQFTIPDRLVGQPQFKGNTIVQMDVRVRDSADHEEQKTHTFHVAVDPIQIEAIPESGRLIPQVENEIFLVASTPDGGVAKPELTVSSKFLDKPVKVQCDENGIATIRLTPRIPERPNNENVTAVTRAIQTIAYVSSLDSPDLNITIETEGKRIDISKHLDIESSESNLLLRVNKGVFQVGDALELAVLSAAVPNESVFVDVLKNDQTVLTKTVRLKEGRGTLSLPLDNQLAGSLTINAYIIGSGGITIRDTRQVVVLRNDDLRIEITTDREEYQPGQPAQLKIAVTDPQGEPVRAALGMNVVDESVYSLSEKEPGLAKVFFAIERELMQPKVEIHGYQLDKVVRLSASDYQKNANLSKALFAKLDTLTEYSINLDTARDKEQRAQNELEQIHNILQWKMLPASFQPIDVAEAMLFLQESPSLVPTIDPWGRPYRLILDKEPDNPEQGNIFIISAGRDGIPGSKDDLRIKNYHQPTIVSASGTRIAGEIRYPTDLVISQGFGGSNILESRDKQDTFYFIQELKITVTSDFRSLQDVHAEPLAMMREAAPGVGGYGMGMMGMRGAENEEDMPLLPDSERENLASLGYLGNDPVRKIPIGGYLDTSYTYDFKNAFANDIERSDLKGQIIDVYGGTFLKEGLERLGISTNGDDASGNPLVVNGQIDFNQLKQLMDKLPDGKALLQESNGQIAQIVDKIKELSSDIKEAATQNQKSVRVRRYFPETLFYTPEAITDDNGLLAINLPPADSITTWRMSAMANAKNGALGDATAAIKVFKPFFIDLDLPVALIQNDEVTIPVGVYNYLPQTQAVRINLERAPWFSLLEGDLQRTITIAANEVASVTYRIRADQLGRQPITVYAWGSQDSDAIGKSIEVRPNGSAQFITQNGRLTGSIQHTIAFPKGRVEGADKLFVKIYPGFFSQVVEGLDAILQMPYGCFEQTSSTTYPNILALQYMKLTGKITPSIEMKAKEYINLGYQRLLTFEIDGGGYEVFGNPPATRILSAYGLMEFADMIQVHPIDANVIARTQAWLMGQMQEDGHWEPDQNYSHAEMWKSIQDNKVLSTAYVALALAKTGAHGPLSQTWNYLTQHANEAKDAYTLAILCNAMLAIDRENPATKRCVQRLVDLSTVQGDRVHWSSEASMSFARGNHASVETTAWAVLALIEDGRFQCETGKALNWIIDQKDPHGTWGTTHGTVLALKALVNALGKQTQKCDATVLVHVNGQEAARLEIKPETSDLFRQLDLTEFAREDNNEVEIDLEGEGSLLYQVVGKYFIPWKTEPKAASQPFDIQVQYDRSELRRNDTVTCQIQAANQKPYRVEMVMIDIGIPPGFRVEQPTLDEYVNNKTIAKYSLTPRQMLIYLQSMEGGQTVKLNVPMKATLPMAAKAPESTIYEYYNPEQKKASPPQELEVK